MLGTLGGIGLLIGPAGLLAEKWKRDPALVDETRTGMDVAFIAMLFLTSLTGMALLVLRDNAGHGPAAGAASRRGVRAVHHHALRQVRSRHLSLCRAGALREGAGADDGGAYRLAYQRHCERSEAIDSLAFP